MLKYCTYMSIIFLLFSCSTVKFKEFFTGKETAEERNEELLKDFGSDNNLLDKFKEQPDSEVKTVKKKKEESKNVIKKTSKKLSKKPKVTKKLIKKKALKTSPVVVSKLPIPKKLKVEKISKFPKLDKKSKTFWSSFQPILFKGEKMVIDITYLGVSTGQIHLTTEPETRIGDKDVYHVRGRVKTASFYSYLYEIDDLCDSYISKKSFIPLKFSLIQRESSQDIDDLQLFDLDESKTYTFYKRVTKKKTRKKKEVKDIPHYFQDPLSVVYFLRGLPLKTGAVYHIPIVNKGKTDVLKAKVVKKEKVRTKIGHKEAFRVDLYTKHKGETLKGGNMQLWYSADERKIFLKFKAKISIGSVFGEISKYEK